MRTLDEINRDLQRCTDENKRRTLKEEKEEVWNTLYEGHRNFRI